MKKLILVPILLGTLWYIQSIDPKTRESNIEMPSIEQLTELSDIDIDIDDVYDYINENWFDVKRSNDNSFDISVKSDLAIEEDVSDDSFVSFTSTPGKSELEMIANKIAYNETRNNRDNLIHWNVGETFASMGIGHFIWYPENRSKEYSEQFPSMIRYLAGLNLDVPKSLLRQIEKGSYWNTKSEWQRDKKTRRYKELLEFLEDTKMQQAQFIQQKFIIDLLRLYSKSSHKEMTYMNKMIKRITSAPGGWYVLVDYTNFKGIGGSPNRKYQDYDWGLKAVLLNMKRFKSNNVLHSFSKSATYTLQQRVKHAPSYRTAQEQKWMKGWMKRTNGYKDPYK